MIIIALFINFIFAQIVPFETSNIFSEKNDKIETIYIDDHSLGENLDFRLEENSNIIFVANKQIFETNILTDSVDTYKVSLSYDNIPDESKFFIIDSNSDVVIGPFYIHSNKKQLDIGPIHSSDFIVQCVLPSSFNLIDYSIKIIKVSSLEELDLDNKKHYSQIPRNRDNPVIVVTGFWPPTNEMIRHFSQDSTLNQEGWQGENWRELGYDIIAFFPEFEDPDCNNCGQGYGNFEVDYQDTSEDFWSLIPNLNPISIITFSRGYIDYSWELEYNYYNRTNWYGDYFSPIYPTPNPPDDNVDVNFLRNSTLPMQSIVDAVNSSNLELNSYIDINGDPGRFVSEFMGYHGVWYHDLYEFDSENPCFLSGHVHVGGLIDWDTARNAAEITIENVIQELDNYIYILGDVNSDQNIDVLDIVNTVAHILGNDILVGSSYYAGDMNSNGIINIQDIILIVNLIL
ncbi:MAG: hypothetical protein CMG26_03235 [Candidatus Marinimicrobia bacterium]|nr:hypothetical protein [Candidatus Neomarinimicrobiota bacterium]